MTVLATDTRDLIGVLCRDFTEATGWPLQFTPLGGSAAKELEEGEILHEPDCCWVSGIDDGTGKVGFLHLSYPEWGGDAVKLSSVSALAGGIARLLSEAATSRRRLETRTREVSTLVDIGLSSRNEESLPDTLSHLLGAAVQLTGYRSAALFLLNFEMDGLQLRATYRLDAGDMPPAVRGVAASRADADALAGGPVYVQGGPSSSEEWLPRHVSSALCVAIRSRDVPLGTLWVYDRRSHAPSDRETHALGSIAAQIADYLERIVLLRESASQQRLVSEVRLASENQNGSMLENLSSHPGFEAAARCVSRHELGGDLCELIPLGDQRTGIAIGDASGNSVPAAMVMSAVRGALRTLPGGDIEWRLGTGQTMARVNQALHEITCAHQFMSLFYGEYDASRRRLTYTNAGHPCPVLMRNGIACTLDSHGLLLGVLKDVSYGSSAIELLPGDLIVLFSDGISEAMNVSQELFRTEGIIRAVRSSSQDSAENALQTIWSHVESHAGKAKELDDRTLLVLRIRDDRSVRGA